MKTFHLFLILAAVSLAFLFLFRDELKPLLSSRKLQEIEVGGEKIRVEVAETAEEKRKGLSGRASLPKNQGMLFVFGQQDLHTFWMENMNFALDFIWIREGRVVDISENITPEDYPPPKTLTPKEPVDAVLEVSAGTVKRLDIRVGDKVNL